MAEYKGPERRRFLRVPIYLPIDFLLFDTEESRNLTEVNRAYSQNISAGGLLLELDTVPNEWIKDLISGRIKIILEFTLPGSNNSIKTSANVAWMARRKELDEDTKPIVMGLNFTEINSEDQDRINKFVLELSSKPR